jgi:hypothetical protein
MPEPSVDGNTVSRWERGIQWPTSFYRDLICDVLGVPANELGLDRPPAARLEPVKRREFLKVAGLVGVGGVLGAGHLGVIRRFPNGCVEAFLEDVEVDIAACWELMRGSEVTKAEPLLLSRLPAIEAVAESQGEPLSVPLRGRLRRLATEGRLLAALVSVLRCDYASALDSNQRAVEHPSHVGDVNLHVAALKHLATRYQDVGHPVRTLEVYRKAARYSDIASPLLRSRTHLGLALAHAHLGDGASGAVHLRIAEDEFPTRFADDPAFSYADCGPSSLNHYTGLIRLVTGDPRTAWETFERLKELDGVPVPARTVLEILNCQAMAAVAWRELELSSTHVEAAASGANRLGSEMRFQEVRRVFDQMRAVWPGEPRVRDLETLFHR